MLSINLWILAKWSILTQDWYLDQQSNKIFGKLQNFQGHNNTV